MRRLLAVIVSAAVATTPGVLAQAKPNFSGTWTLDWNSIPVPPGGRRPGTGPGYGAPRGGAWGEQFRAIQDAATLRVEYVDREITSKLTFKLDGSETKNVVTAPPRGRAEHVTKAAWVGDRLVITIITTLGDARQTVSLDRGALLLELLIPVEEGPPITGKFRYTKS